MPKDHAIQEGADDGFFVVGEAGDGLELEAEVLVGAAGVLTEEEQIRADLESDGEAADDVEGRLGGARFVAAQLDDVHGDFFGELRPSEAPLLAEGGETRPENRGRARRQDKRTERKGRLEQRA